MAPTRRMRRRPARTSRAGRAISTPRRAASTRATPGPARRRGTGVRIIDIEGAWRFTHEDLLQNQGGVVGGTQTTDIGWRNHGTAVIGEFGGDRNAFGVTGICPDANVRARLDLRRTGGRRRDPRRRPTALTPGDIILIELHRPGPRATSPIGATSSATSRSSGGRTTSPPSATPSNRGVIVVEAAGNGAENLDDAIYNTPPTGFPADWTQPVQSRPIRDSGAIVVGAGAPPPGTHGRDHGPDRSRLDFSNYGALVDAQGWGREVTTGRLRRPAGRDQRGPLVHRPVQRHLERLADRRRGARLRAGRAARAQAGRCSRRPRRASCCARPARRSRTRPVARATQRIGNRPNLRQLISRLMTPGENGEFGAREDLLVDHALEQRVARLELEVAELRALSAAELST